MSIDCAMNSNVHSCAWRRPTASRSIETNDHGQRTTCRSTLRTHNDRTCPWTEHVVRPSVSLVNRTSRLFGAMPWDALVRQSRTSYPRATKHFHPQLLLRWFVQKKDKRCGSASVFIRRLLAPIGQPAVVVSAGEPALLMGGCRDQILQRRPAVRVRSRVRAEHDCGCIRLGRRG